MPKSLITRRASFVRTCRVVRPRVEILEDRLTPATFTVVNTLNSGAGSLRQAILDANAHANSGGPDAIAFNIPTSDAGHVYYRDDAVAGQVTLANATATTASDDSTIADIDPDWAHSWWSILPTTSLPAITGATVVDGFTQEGSAPNTLAVGSDAVLRVEVRGGGFDLRGDSAVLGLTLNRITATSVFPIVLRGETGGNIVEGNFIGSDVSGTLKLANTIGIYVISPGNRIGGITPEARNVISGNNATGLVVSGEGNIIQGNYVGTNAAGTAALGNSSGILVSSDHNTIGGTAPGSRNVISGNLQDGINVQGDNNLIQGNFIGTDATGTRDLGNNRYGVALITGSGNQVGGTDAAACNVISGNNVAGINIAGPNSVIQGNHIGTDVTGTQALGNGTGILVSVSGLPNTIIGGTGAGAGNLISANTIGMTVATGSTGQGIVVQGNRIGTKANGVDPLGNTSHGINITSTVNVAGNHLIGGTSAGAGNIIAFNQGDGVFVANTLAFGNAILGNSIFGNVGLGIDLNPNGVTSNDANDADTGANRLQNFPTLSGALLVGGRLSVTASLRSKPDTTYWVEFFANSAADPSGHGEGQRFLGSVSAATDPNGDWQDTITLASTVAEGEVISATATDPTDGTSEFSDNVAIVRLFRPTATPDGYTVFGADVLTILAPGVLENDSDPDGAPLTAVLVAGPTQGTLMLDADGSFSYKPFADLEGDDSFTYFARDPGGAESDPVTVTLTHNRRPVAVGGVLIDNPGASSLSGEFSASDPDGDPVVSVTLVDAPVRGAVQLTLVDGEVMVEYTPRQAFIEGFQDHFTYQVSDGQLLSAPVRVDVRVNRAPTAVGGAITRPHGVQAPLDVVLPWSDPEGSPLTAQIVDLPTHGRVTPVYDAQGQLVNLRYTPVDVVTGRDLPDVRGPDHFTYQVVDSLGRSSNVVEVDIRVPNRSPLPGVAYFRILVDDPRSITNNDEHVDLGHVEGNILTDPLGLHPATGTRQPDGDLSDRIKGVVAYPFTPGNIGPLNGYLLDLFSGINDGYSLTNDMDGDPLTLLPFSGETEHGSVLLGNDGRFDYQFDEINRYRFAYLPDGTPLSGVIKETDLTVYRLTSSSANALRQQGVPDSIINKLTVNNLARHGIPHDFSASSILDRAYRSGMSRQATQEAISAEFLRGLEKVLGTVTARNRFRFIKPALAQSIEVLAVEDNQGTLYSLVKDELLLTWGTDSFPFQLSDGYAVTQAMAGIQFSPEVVGEANIKTFPVLYVDASLGVGALSFDALVASRDRLTIREQPRHGHLDLTQDGIVYTPDPDFRGVDHVRYGVTQTSHFFPEPSPGSAPVVLRYRFTLEGDIYFVVNGAGPGVHDSSYVAASDRDLSVPAERGLLTTVVRNGHPVVVDSVSQPQHGQIVSFGRDGAFTYRPEPGFHGTDTFVARIANDFGDTDQVHVTIDVRDDESVAFVSDSSDRPLTIISPPGTSLRGVKVSPTPPVTPPRGAQFPLGYIDFEVHGLPLRGKADVHILLPPGAPPMSEYWKYERYRREDLRIRTRWVRFSGAEFKPGEIVLHLQDGGAGDFDILRNGTIVDPGGPAVGFPPRVESINPDGDRNQSSQVKSLTVTFDSRVTVRPGAFEVYDGAGQSVRFRQSLSVIDGSTVAVIELHDDHSLSDPHRLVLHGNRIRDRFGRSLDGDRDGLPGGTVVFTFARRAPHRGNRRLVDGTE